MNGIAPMKRIKLPRIFKYEEPQQELEKRFPDFYRSHHLSARRNIFPPLPEELNSVVATSTKSDQA
jgi:hypothetical protein